MENKKEILLNKIKLNLNMSNIGIMLIILILVVFNFIIGANDKGLRIEPISVLFFLIILYLIIFKIKNKEKSIFFKSKVDYFVLIFMITTTLPFIFKTYSSYSDNIEFIIKYFFIYSIYVLVRNVVVNKKAMEIIITATLVCSLIPAIFGLDILYTHFLDSFIKWANLTYSKLDGLHGPFGYANTQAIYIAFCIFLAMHKFKVNNKKMLKVIDILYIIFAATIILLTKSLAVVLLLGIVLLGLIITKYRKILLKYKNKILISTVSLVGILVIFLSITLNINDKIVTEGDDINEQIIYNFKKDETYSLELYMKTEDTETSKKNRTKVLEIELLEYGKYFKNMSILKQNCGYIDGYYRIDFTPTQDTRYVRIKINNLFRGKITIDDVYINGEKQIIKFKYYPFYVGHFLRKLYMPGKSVPERLYMYKDCLKIAKNNVILGNGGNAWEVLSRSVAEYECAYKECHSYFFELLISYGLIGLAAFLILVAYLFIKIFKQCKKNIDIRKQKLLIAIGLLLLILHSFIEFNMSFMLIQIIVYTYIAILQYDENNLVKNKNLFKVFDYIIIVFLIFIFSLYLREGISKYIVQDNLQKYLITPYNKDYYLEKIKQEYNKDDSKIELLDELQDFIRKEPYNVEQTNNYEKYFNVMYKNLENFSQKDLEKYLNFLVESLENVPFRVPFGFYSAINRQTTLNNFVKKFEEYNKTNKNELIKTSINRIKQVLVKEHKVNVENMQDYNKHNYDYSQIQQFLKYEIIE